MESPTKPQPVDAIARAFDVLGCALQANADWRGRYPYCEDAFSCDGGALVARHLAELIGLGARIAVGLYHHPDIESYLRVAQGDAYVDGLSESELAEEAACWGEPVEHHHWLVVEETWLVDPNGEIRGEPRVQLLEEAEAYEESGLSEIREIAYDPDISLEEILEGLSDHEREGVRHAMVLAERLVG
jgi:hypothetical protein